jgi:uncharacterized repeat protein (TIGR01451 family)
MLVYFILAGILTPILKIRGDKTMENELPGSVNSDISADSKESLEDRNKEEPEEVTDITDFSGSTIKATDINGEKLWAGDIIRYDIEIVNSGSISGKNMILSCPVPGETGYVKGSASGAFPIINEDMTLIEWNIYEIKQDEKMNYSFEVFIADYVTFKNEIRSNFVLKDGYKIICLDNPEVAVTPFAFNTIVCMGDSQIVLTGWPDILDEHLENFYIHADFNVISSAEKGESAVDAIKRFDRDIRPNNPDIIILGYGTNDAGELSSIFEYDMDILIRQALSTGAEVFVYGIGYIDTSISKWNNKVNYTDFNRILEDELCPRYDVSYIDISTPMSADYEKYLRMDGIHWNEEGANLVALEVFKTIVAHIDEDGNILK